MRLVVSLALVAAAATGCTSEQPEATPETIVPTPTVMTATFEPAEPTLSPMPTAAPNAGVLASCSDPAGDSSGALDLRSVKVSAEDGEILFSFQYTGEAPDTGGALYSVLAGTKQYGYKTVDGQRSGHFIFDLSAGTQENYELRTFTNTSASGNTTGFDLPVDDVADLVDGSAVLNVNGEDLDDCKLQ